MSLKKSLFFLTALICIFKLTFINNISHPEWIDHSDSNDQSSLVTPSINGDLENQFSENVALTQDFNHFIENFGASPFYLKKNMFLDTTGDGELEEVRQIVSLEGNSCVVQNIILKKGAEIWNDEHRINLDHVNCFFGNDQASRNFQPYALFYLGLLKSNFLGKFEDSENRSQWDSNFIKKLSIFEIDKLNHYRGYYAVNMNDGNRGIYIWDADTGKFKCVMSSAASVNHT